MSIILKSLHLHNFKCFKNHTIFFDDATIMIGQNNAGKTTVVEALRILGLTTSRFKNISTYSVRPSWLEDILPLSAKGIKISAKAIDTDLERVFFRYGDPPAIIRADFSNKTCIYIYINSETELFATCSLNGSYVSSKSRADAVGIPNVRVLPQIVPLSKDELRVSTETLQRNRFSKRTSGNFRNNLFIAKSTDTFGKLQNMIEQTWGRLQISEVSVDDRNCVYLDMRDGDFVTEIYYMGHGIQMWLQTLWFIVSSSSNSIIVLDEPDVYIHADLQRKLVRMLRGNYDQVVIATHSVEIISEVLPENILIIDRSKSESIFADGYPVLQTAVSGLGSIHNINLTRLLNNKRYLFVEGYDIDILKILYDKLFSKSSEPLDHLPSVQTGGWGGWAAQKENALQLLHEIPELKIYFFFDRDYHSDDDINSRKKEAQDCNIRLHVWARKEIENYLLCNTAIARFVSKKNPEFEYDTLCQEIKEEIINICNSLKDRIIEHIADDIPRKKMSTSQAFNAARDRVEREWQTPEGIIKIVSGKEVLKRLSNHCKTKYGVSFSSQQIASSLLTSEICEEVAKILGQVKDAK